MFLKSSSYVDKKSEKKPNDPPILSWQVENFAMQSKFYIFAGSDNSGVFNPNFTNSER